MVVELLAAGASKAASDTSLDGVAAKGRKGKVGPCTFLLRGMNLGGLQSQPGLTWQFVLRR